MSCEDVELRDLVAQTLENNGCLAKIRAQLRASIFLAMDEDTKVSSQQPLLNTELKRYLETNEGQTMFCIVREFLEFFNLQFTISVYEPETYCGHDYQYEGRQKIVNDLGLNSVDDNRKVPILLHIMKMAELRTKNTVEINLNVNTNNAECNSPDDHNSQSNIKTDLDNSTTTNTSKSSANSSSEKLPKFLLDVQNNAAEKNYLNQTFNLSNPTISPNQEMDNSKTQSNFKDSYKDDTYEDTSSIAEDCLSQNLDKSLKSQLTNGNEITHDPNEIQHATKSKSDLKSLKSDKIKPKSSLTTLDLPPIQKYRVNDILPSPYSKEFKEKSNFRELDKLFDMEQEYEEDFMSGAEMDLSSKSISELSSKSNQDNSTSKSLSVPKLQKTLKDIKINNPVNNCNKQVIMPSLDNSKSNSSESNNGGSSTSIGNNNSD